MGKRCHLVLIFCSALSLAGWQVGLRAADGKQPAAPAAKISFTKDVAPVLAKYCTSCHGGEKPKAGLNLAKFTDDNSAFNEWSLWEKVADKLKAGQMPPKRRPQPTAEEKVRLIAWNDTVVALLDCTKKKDPGRVTIRRLNRVEYKNTIRDLVGVDFHGADDFPSDNVGYGFDNIGDALSLPPLLLEKYLAAAEKITEQAFKSPELRKRILIAPPNDTDAARKIIERFASRAFRRPLRDGEVDKYLRLVEMAKKNGDSFETGIHLAVQAILVSPHFLFRIEFDGRPNDPGIRTLNDFELATRLSYFLWSSMPDEELFGLARKGELRKNANLEVQVRRMLKEPKSRALVENFAGQWLQLRNLRTAQPDPGLFPSFDEALRSAMQKETELFFEAVMKEDRSVLDFLDADFTFVNERLARHYGINGVKGNEFRRITLPDNRRGGVLTQASVLTVTSNPTRTSPVKRGKWVLENLLGDPPPPPPPDVPELKEDKQVVLSGTLRQRMEQHRRNPNCAVCHQRLDPLGFGLENFDAVGGWRERDGKFPIDSSGTLPDGKSFNGPAALRSILKGKQDQFRRCLTEKMLTYALGRGLESYDKCVVDEIATALGKNQNKFSTLVVEIVRSGPFQKRSAARRR